MKTEEELKELKKEYELLSNKLKKLSKEELRLVIGGIEMKPSIGLDLGLDNANIE